jgi:hypothetical protein
MFFGDLRRLLALRLKLRLTRLVLVGQRSVAACALSRAARYGLDADA